MSMNWQIGLINTEHVLKHPKTQDLIRNQEKRFDLVVVEEANTEAFYLFALKFNCPLVTIGEKLNSL